MKDGSRFTDKSNYETIGFVEEMKNRDPRLTQTFVQQDMYVMTGKNICQTLSWQN